MLCGKEKSTRLSSNRRPTPRPLRTRTRKIVRDRALVYIGRGGVGDGAIVVRTEFDVIPAFSGLFHIDVVYAIQSPVDIPTD